MALIKCILHENSFWKLCRMYYILTVSNNILLKMIYRHILVLDVFLDMYDSSINQSYS